MGTTSENIARKITKTPTDYRDPKETDKTEGYQIIFKNNSEQVWPLWFPDRPTERIFPGQIFETEVTDPYNIYARYECVEFLGNYQFDFTVRPGWKEPKREGYVVEFLNADGCTTEVVQILGGDSVRLPKGIPIFASVSPMSPFSEFKKYTIKKVSLGKVSNSHFEDVEIYEDREVINNTRHEGYADKHIIKEKIKKRVEVFDDPIEKFKIDVVLEDRRNAHDLQQIVEQRKVIREKEAKFRQEIG